MLFLRRQMIGPTLSLFASTGTLVCCALPALFITLGMGAVFAGLVSQFPQLIWLSERKACVFALAGVLIALSAYLRWLSRFDPCPADPALAVACTRARQWSGYVLIAATVLYGVGGFFAFLAPRLL